MQQHTYNEIRKIANGVAFQWPHAVEAEDLAQDVAMLICASPNVLAKIEEMGPKERKSSLYKLAHQEASRQLTEYEHFSANYLYSVDEVRKLLESGALTELDPVEFKAAKVDVQEALRLLREDNQGYAASLAARYIAGEIPDRTSNERKRLNRAVDALTILMNRLGAERRRAYTEGPGTRKVLSRDQAAWITAEQSFIGQGSTYLYGS